MTMSELFVNCCFEKHPDFLHFVGISCDYHLYGYILFWFLVFLFVYSIFILQFSIQFVLYSCFFRISKSVEFP